jgi:hypothetical protein
MIGIGCLERRHDVGVLAGDAQRYATGGHDRETGRRGEQLAPSATSRHRLKCLPWSVIGLTMMGYNHPSGVAHRADTGGAQAQ